MDKKQILLKKQYGDLNMVAAILTNKLGRNITPSNAARLIDRDKAKHHQQAIDALRKVVEARENLIATQQV